MSEDLGANAQNPGKASCSSTAYTNNVPGTRLKCAHCLRLSSGYLAASAGTKLTCWVTALPSALLWFRPVDLTKVHTGFNLKTGISSLLRPCLPSPHLASPLPCTLYLHSSLLFVPLLSCLRKDWISHLIKKIALPAVPFLVPFSYSQAAFYSHAKSYPWTPAACRTGRGKVPLKLSQAPSPPISAGRFHLGDSALLQPHPFVRSQNRHWRVVTTSLSTGHSWNVPTECHHRLAFLLW